MEPKTLEQFVGQKTAKEILWTMVQASRAQQGHRPAGHILLFGPPGLGKTTLARIVANEIGGQQIELSGATLEKPHLLQIFVIYQFSVLLIDEIHSLRRETAEVLYSAMDHFAVMLGGFVPHEITPFTLIGMTTEPAKILPPLRSRFQAQVCLDYYSSNELAQIVAGAAPGYGIQLDQDAALEIGKRSRGTPRTAKQLLATVANFSIANNVKHPSRDQVVRWLRIVVDDLGLSELERRYMIILITKFNGGPVGMNTIASALGLSPQTIIEVERYLLRLGFIKISPSGREITENGIIWIARTAKSGMLAINNNNAI